MGNALWTTLAGGTKPNGWKTRKERPKTARPAGASKKKRISPVSKARKANLTLYAREKRRYLKTHPICERCWAKKSEHIHHKRGRIGDLLHNQDFFAAVCFACHEWIGRNPTAARAEGLIAEEGGWNSKPKEK